LGRVFCGEIMTQQKIAFIHYPHSASSARLDTMPFAFNIIANLARLGWQVDLYLWETKSNSYEDAFSDNVQIHYFTDPPPSRLNQVRPALQSLRYSWLRKRYHLVFGLGQIGIHIAHTIAQANHCPLVYVNDEFPSCWGQTYWQQAEQTAATAVDFVIVPDAQRFLPLAQELPISQKPYVGLPNVPVVEAALTDIDWPTRLGIPADRPVFLHAGSVADWAQIPEMLCTLPHWPEESVLLVHSRSSQCLDDYRQQLSHLNIPGRVFWSCEPMTSNDLNSLVGFCAGSFALYRNTGSNIEYMGTSSGKLMRSVACATPVIASRFDSLAFVETEQIGHLVKHPCEIPAAIQSIIDCQSTYRQNCRQFYREFAAFDLAWEEFCEKLHHSIGVNLKKSLISPKSFSLLP
jgi:glycosyltransferase involved in cell wall biosynthesis